MRADNTRRRMRERLMVDGHLCVHDLLERGAILVAVAELEPRVRRAGNIDVLVVGESIKLPRKCVLADRLERPRGWSMSSCKVVRRCWPSMMLLACGSPRIGSCAWTTIAPRKCLASPAVSRSLSSASRLTSCHSGAHCSSLSQTCGRWNGGTTRCCGCMKTSCGVRT